MKRFHPTVAARFRALAVILALSVFGAPRFLAAQSARLDTTCAAAEHLRLRLDPEQATAGSVAEDDIRILQMLGCVPWHGATIRPAPPGVLRGAAMRSGGSWRALRRADVVVQGWINSHRPGALPTPGVWTGRGFTAAISGGMAARLSVLSVSVQPMAFLTQNARYVPPGVAASELLGFGNPYVPGFIDLPYRFGDHSYGRIDAAESGARIDLPLLAFGFSTGAQALGPGRQLQLVLGPGAGGFHHGFLETSEPWNILVGQVTGRMFVGRLEASPFTPGDSGARSRVASGFALSFTPRLFPGMEVGASRMFHRRWPESGLTWDLAAIPFEGFLKDRLKNKFEVNPESDNQIASAFFRIAPPGARYEVYGEFMRDDHSVNSRDLIVETEHASAYMVGARRLWFRGRNDVIAATAELVDAMNPNDLLLRRDPVRSLHTHHILTEGHTHRGLPLAAPGVFGGTEARVDVERIRARSRTALQWRNVRAAHDDASGRWNGMLVGAQSLSLQHARLGGTADLVLRATQTLDWHASGSSLRGSFEVHAAFVIRGSAGGRHDDVGG